MLDTVVSRTGNALIGVIRNAVEEALRQKNNWVGTEHLLIGLARQPNTIAASALASMKIDAGSAQTEVEQYLRMKEVQDDSGPGRACRSSNVMLRRILLPSDLPDERPALTDTAIQALIKAEEYSHYFGEEEIDPAHLLLGILDLRQAAATKIFEELSTNLTFLRRQVMQLLAARMCWSPKVVGLRSAVIGGLKELVNKHDASLAMVSELAAKGGRSLQALPSRSEILHMVCVAYLPEFLYTQVAFQRFLLEESLALLSKRGGPLDKETSAAIVALNAQNIRLEVRATIEYLWSHEYRLIHHMFDEAEHDLIGSVVEDLWWAQSEEIALNQSFACALEDHRRAQLLSLQKRRIEIANRLTKLKARLDETVKQCFLRRSISA
jgi:ATP-dependent Clp protease ATP-binding subunit ClpC